MKLMNRSMVDRRWDRVTLWDLHHGHQGFQSTGCRKSLTQDLDHAESFMKSTPTLIVLVDAMPHVKCFTPGFRQGYQSCPLFILICG